MDVLVSDAWKAASDADERWCAHVARDNACTTRPGRGEARDGSERGERMPQDILGRVHSDERRSNDSSDDYDREASSSEASLAANRSRAGSRLHTTNMLGQEGSDLEQPSISRDPQTSAATAATAAARRRAQPPEELRPQAQPPDRPPQPEGAHLSNSVIADFNSTGGCWSTVEVKRLPKEKPPQVFKTGAPHLYSAHELHKCEACDSAIDGSGTPDRAIMGFRKEYQCAELVHVPRGITEKAAEWGTPRFFSQVDFGRAYDSVLHSAVVRAMLRRGVPPPILGAYVRDMRGTELVFQHDGWAFDAITPGVLPEPLRLAWPPKFVANGTPQGLGGRHVAFRVVTEPVRSHGGDTSLGCQAPSRWLV